VRGVVIAMPCDYRFNDRREGGWVWCDGRSRWYSPSHRCYGVQKMERPVAYHIYCLVALDPMRLEQPPATSCERQIGVRLSLL